MRFNADQKGATLSLSVSPGFGCNRNIITPWRQKTASVCNKGDRELCLELDVALHATLAYCWASKPDGSLLVLHRTGARIML